MSVHSVGSGGNVVCGDGDGDFDSVIVALRVIGGNGGYIDAMGWQYLLRQRR